MYRINKISKENTRVNKVMNLFSIAIYIIFIPLIIFNFTLILKSFFNPTKTPDFFGFKNYIIVSGSMEPTIHVGDAIFIKEVAQDKIKVNDIISFQDGDTITTHRIVKMENENGIIRYTTKGDNNHAEDKDKIVYSKIEGVYQFKISGFGKVNEVLKSKITLVIIIIIVFMNFLYTYRRNKINQMRREKRTKYNNRLNKNL